MPTGYTAEVPKGQSFEEFVLRCARNFGALILMRDDPMDAEIPEFQPSDHYLRLAEKAECDLAEWKAMDSDARREWGNAQVIEAMQGRRKWNAEYARANEAYDAMLARVLAWTPPTPDHAGLKTFMIEQLTISKEPEGREYSGPTAPELIRARADQLAHDVAHYRAEHEKEVERTAQRNAWVKALRDSLKEAVKP